MTEEQAPQSEPTVPDLPVAGARAADEAEPSSGAAVKLPEFAPLRESRPGGGEAPLDRFYDVHVSVWAELGRVQMPLGELMKLNEGAVLRLDRPVSEPVDLVSQGVKLAKGEVVVVDDCFAIRIKSIESAK